MTDEIDILRDSEKNFSEIAFKIDLIMTLSKAVLENLYDNLTLKPVDVQNLAELLTEQTEILKEKFSSLIEKVNF